MTKHTVSTIRVPPRRQGSVLQLSGATLTVGTEVLTSKGLRPVEDLKPGDALITKDYGLQKLRYIAFQDANIAADPALAPVKISNRHLGFDQTTHVAPEQLIACRHPMFDMMFGSAEVFVRCGDLIDQPGFEQINGLGSLTYVALGFARRHILACNGGALEVGPMSQKPCRLILGPEEAVLAIQLLQPKSNASKRHSFPLH